MRCVLKQHLSKKLKASRPSKASKYEAVRQDAHVEFLSDGNSVISTGISKIKDHLLYSSSTGGSSYKKEISERYEPKAKYDINTIVLFNKIRLSSDVSKYIPVVFTVSCILGVILGAWMCI